MAAIIWANLPSSEPLPELRLQVTDLDLNLATWAADGLLAIFFFVAGLELKREFVAGDLRDPRRAAVPVAAALGGVIVPAAAVPAGQPRRRRTAPRGWAIPTATDIAFALAVLAVIGRHLPDRAAHVPAHPGRGRRPARHRHHRRLLHRAPVGAAAAGRAGPAGRVRRAGAAAGPVVVAAAAAGRRHLGAGARLRRARHRRRGAARPSPCRSLRSDGPAARTPGPGLAEHFEHRFRPISAGVAVPVFAFLSAGVTIGGLSGLAAALTDPVAVGIIVGLVVGKPIGITAATWLVARFTRADLDDGPGLDRRGRPGRARRYRVHRLPAHRRAGLRHRQRHATTTSRSPSWPAP